MGDIRLELAVLSDEQVCLWREFGDVPCSFVLCGGTAVALHLGHRASLDFDFFSQERFDPDELYHAVGFLEGSKAIQKSANTLTCTVERGRPVQVSFFGVPSIQLINRPLISPDNDLRIATLIDLAGMKCGVVQKRAEAKDYIDLDAIIQHGKIDLSVALAAAKAIYGPAFNPELTLKSLSYFGDGNLPTLPKDVQNRLIEVVRSVDLASLPAVERNQPEA